MVSLCVFAVASDQILAQADILLQGQTHFYSLFQRGDRGVVVAKLIFTNDSSDLIRYFEFYTKEELSNLKAWQLNFDSNCTTYQIDLQGLKLTPVVNQKLQNLFKEVGKTIKIVNNGNIEKPDKEIMISKDQLVCVAIAEQIDPETFDKSDAELFLQKTEVRQDGYKYTVAIPNPIPEGQTGAVVLSYDLASDNNFVWNNLVWSGLRVNAPINQVVFSLVAEKGNIIKDKNTEIVVSKMSDEATFLLDSFSNTPTTPNVKAINLIGRVGEYMTQSDYLMPNETWTVDLKITDQKWKFYWNYYMTTLIVLIILGVGIWLYIRNNKPRRW